MQKSKLGAAMAATTLFALLMLGCGDSEESSDAEKSSNGAEVVSADELREVAAEGKTPVYWIGEQNGAELELSQPSESRTYVRYLTDGADAGDPRPRFLTVSTYAQPKAVAALRRQAGRPGGLLGSAPGNATVYYSRSDPQSVYLAYPGVPVEIEVYDPSFKRALQLVNSGQIVAVG
jgi:hypothetical protein